VLADEKKKGYDPTTKKGDEKERTSIIGGLKKNVLMVKKRTAPKRGVRRGPGCITRSKKALCPDKRTIDSKETENACPSKKGKRVKLSG